MADLYHWRKLLWLKIVNSKCKSIRNDVREELSAIRFDLEETLGASHPFDCLLDNPCHIFFLSNLLSLQQKPESHMEHCFNGGTQLLLSLGALYTTHLVAQSTLSH